VRKRDLREDRLREEYFDLLPEIRKVVQELEVRIHYYTLPILQGLQRHEKLVIRSRVKEFESALSKLSRKNKDKGESRVLDPQKEYSILGLRDLAGVRVLAFPDRRISEVDDVLRSEFDTWESDPIPYEGGAKRAPKYHGYCENISQRVKGEYQVVPMLIGLFWDVEHSAMYKSDIVANSRNMKRRRAVVERSLAQFEEGIASLLPDPSQPASHPS